MLIILGEGSRAVVDLKWGARFRATKPGLVSGEAEVRKWRRVRKIKDGKERGESGLPGPQPRSRTLSNLPPLRLWYASMTS